MTSEPKNQILGGYLMNSRTLATEMSMQLTYNYASDEVLVSATQNG